MKEEKIDYYWYKIGKDLSVKSQSEDKHFDHHPDENQVLWIEKSGPHGWIVTPDIYDDPIYHYQFFDVNKKPIDHFHIRNNWSLVGMSTITRFRESSYSQFHIKDPQNVLKTRKIWSETEASLKKHLSFIRDTLGEFDSWETYEASINNKS